LVTAHDGFTLHDLVSYNRKHNEANLEDNHDGENHNNSWNHGVEGPTDDPQVVSLRERQKRNLLATLMLSQGVPMISAGDEMVHTQLGNNNAYCQDNELSWLDWDLTPAETDLLNFVRYLSQLRQAQPGLRRDSFFTGERIGNPGIKDVTWFDPAGGEVQGDAWGQPGPARLGARILGEPVEDGGEERSDTLFVMVNAGPDPVRFALPESSESERWERLFDTNDLKWNRRFICRGKTYRLQGPSCALFRLGRVRRAH
jgi:glycogen operon protein